MLWRKCRGVMPWCKWCNVLKASTHALGATFLYGTLVYAGSEDALLEIFYVTSLTVSTLTGMPC
jgi:hypothetical protein